MCVCVCVSKMCMCACASVCTRFCEQPVGCEASCLRQVTAVVFWAEPQGSVVLIGRFLENNINL